MNRNLGSASHLGQFPAELQNIVDHSQWNDIVTELRAAESDALLMACGGEWCCCLCTGFFCIFCFHPMLNDSLAKSNLEKACRSINARFFRGQPTLYVDSGMNIYLGVNTLNQFQSYATPYPTTQTPIVQPYEDKGSQVYINGSVSTPIATAQVVREVQSPVEERHAQFVVPDGVTAGTTVSTTSPAGNQVTIVIPPGTASGSVVTYSY